MLVGKVSLKDAAERSTELGLVSVKVSVVTSFLAIDAGENDLVMVA